MNIPLRYLEAIEEVVRVDHLNYKVLAEDFYNVFCQHVFFGTLEVCEAQFYQALITNDYNDVVSQLNKFVNTGQPKKVKEEGKYQI